MNTQKEAENQTDGLAIPDIRLVNRITTLMQTESFALSILQAIWELIQKKLTRLSRKFVNALKGATSESNT
jgi:hypothetical protein